MRFKKKFFVLLMFFSIALFPSSAMADEEVDDDDYFEESSDKVAERMRSDDGRYLRPVYDEDNDDEDSSTSDDKWFLKSKDRYRYDEIDELSEEEQKRLDKEAKAAQKTQKKIDKTREQRAKAKEKDAKAAAKKAAKEEKRLEKEARAEEKAIEKDQKANRKFAQKQRTRYVKLFKDNDFTYYMDSETAKWVNVPYSAESKMIDVWVQLVEGDNHAQITTVTKEDMAGEYEAKRAEYTPPAKYFLEHYYLWPERQKIQFLCELEVTGKPDNVIDQRKYNIKNWEELVPGSIEDNIYHSVVARMNKKHSILGIPTNGRSGRDMLEEYGRISL